MAQGPLKMARDCSTANHKWPARETKFLNFAPVPPAPGKEVSTIEPPGALVAREGCGDLFLVRGQKKYLRNTGSLGLYKLFL